MSVCMCACVGGGGDSRSECAWRRAVIVGVSVHGGGL